MPPDEFSRAIPNTTPSGELKPAVGIADLPDGAEEREAAPRGESVDNPSSWPPTTGIPPSLLAAMKQARAHPIGISVAATNPTMAPRLRRQFYRVRARLRRAGIHDYDGLSFVIRDCGVVWIVNRDGAGVPQLPAVPFYVAPLQPGDVKRPIGARGPAKLGEITHLIERVQALR